MGGTKSKPIIKEGIESVVSKNNIPKSTPQVAPQAAPKVNLTPPVSPPTMNYERVMSKEKNNNFAELNKSTIETISKFNVEKVVQKESISTTDNAVAIRFKAQFDEAKNNTKPVDRISESELHSILSKTNNSPLPITEEDVALLNKYYRIPKIGPYKGDEDLTLAK